MELTCKYSVIEFNQNTREHLRKFFGLDSQERLDEAIDILVKWLEKQDHLSKKDFSKDYLERSIIMSKGSLERVKTKFDKVATLKTLLPRFFEPFDIKSCTILKTTCTAFVPKMTKDHDRIVISKHFGGDYQNMFDVYRYCIMISEFIQAYDYCKSLIVIFDSRDVNLMDLIKALNLLDMRQSISIMTECYKFNIKAFHFLTSSKAIDTLLALFKQAISPKLGERIHIHKDLETMYEYIPKEVLPKDYGGDEKSIKELSDNLIEVISSEEFTEYYNEMRLARTNETYRSDEKFNEQHLGMPGSFRKLSVD